jgi:hypothetical protein
MSDDLDLRPIKSRLAALDEARRAVAIARAIPWELVGERAYALEQSLMAEARAAGAMLDVAERDLAALVAEAERLRARCTHLVGLDQTSEADEIRIAESMARAAARERGEGER